MEDMVSDKIFAAISRNKNNLFPDHTHLLFLTITSKLI